jgi:hypothetical protein
MISVGFFLFMLAWCAMKLENRQFEYSDNTKAFFGFCIISGVTLMVVGAAVFLWGAAP